MMQEPITTGGAPAAIGPYAQGWCTDDMVYVSGQLGIELSTGKLADGVEAQARASMHNLGAILEAAGSGYDRILKTTIFVKDLADFAAVNGVYAEFFDGSYPARSCVQVAGLPLGGLVEVECVATRG